jgi:hypothetical protein
MLKKIYNGLIILIGSLFLAYQSMNLYQHNVFYIIIVIAIGLFAAYKYITDENVVEWPNGKKVAFLGVFGLVLLIGTVPLNFYLDRYSEPKQSSAEWFVKHHMGNFHNGDSTIPFNYNIAEDKTQTDSYIINATYIYKNENCFMTIPVVRIGVDEWRSIKADLHCDRQ